MIAMIRWLLKRGIAVAALWLLRRYKALSLDLLNIRAATYYVRGVQATRTAALASLTAAGLIAVIGAGFAVLPVGLAVLIYGLSGSWVAPCALLLVLGALYLIVPLIILSRCMSERSWMRSFKVDELIARVTGKSESD
jgi:hypothetical protein